MAKKDPTEDALAMLATLRSQPASPAAHALLSKSLQSKVNLVIARAAAITADMKFADLAPVLEAAFERFLVTPSTIDKQCTAKVAILRALDQMEIPSTEIFLKAARHIQMESVWGGQEDSAVELRSCAGTALVNSGYRDIFTVLVDLLADPYAPVRMSAARAIAAVGQDQGLLLLRLKILSGDASADVIAECIVSMMSLSPRKSLEFVERYLDDPDEIISQSAALSLGQSHLPEALTILLARYEKCASEDRFAYLLPIAMTRLPESVTFLCAQATETVRAAGEITKQMSLYRHDAAIVERLRKSIAIHRSASLNAQFEKVFGPAPSYLPQESKQ